MKFQPRRLTRYYYLRFLRLKGDPHSIARGVGIGIFIGITPTIPFHTVALLIMAPLCRANFIAAFTASASMCNPLTYFPQYYLSWLIGNFLTPRDLSWERISAVMEIVLSDAGYGEILHSLSTLGMDTVIILLLGGVVLATPPAILAYFASLRFFIALRDKKRAKHILH